MRGRSQNGSSATVYRWDLDKTYLRTEFDTMGDLVRTAFETPQSKRTVPGAAALLRELQRTEPRAICILSGSPEQMRRVLESKLRHDGVRWDEFVLKPSLENLLRGRFRFLRDQLGYKLGVLLRSRRTVGGETSEILFGDDAESDAFIYSFYADICRGAVDRSTFDQILDVARVYPDDAAALREAFEAIPTHDAVHQVFIHLDRVSSADAFAVFGARVCPIYNYFQTSVVLAELGAIDAAAALRVGAEIVLGNRFNPEALLASVHDIVRRGFVGRRTADALAVAAQGLEEGASPGAAVLRAFGTQLGRELHAFGEPPPRAHVDIDYASLFEAEQRRARAAKARAVWRRS